MNTDPSSHEAPASDTAAVHPAPLVPGIVYLEAMRNAAGDLTYVPVDPEDVNPNSWRQNDQDRSSY
jgi:hypothetical protein